jgi:hypothetical protein
MKRQRAFVGFVHLNRGINGKWLVLSIVLATVAFASFADSPPVFLTIGGTVNRTVSVTVTPQNNYNSLDLANGETEKLVAIVNERSNDKAGYSVTLTSTGAGSTSQAILQPATPGNPDTISYTLKYGGTPVILNQGSCTLAGAGGRTSSAGTNNLLKVNIPAAVGVAADAYSDTLKLTIQGN